MVGQVCSAVDAAVCAVARWQVGLEGLRLGHLHHVSGAGLLAGVRAGTGRVAALLYLLTEETLEDASKSRLVVEWVCGTLHTDTTGENRACRGEATEVMRLEAWSTPAIFSKHDPDYISSRNAAHLLEQSFDYNNPPHDYNLTLVREVTK